VRGSRALSLSWSAFAVGCCLWLAWSLISAWWPSLPCRAGVAGYCAEASLQALERDPPDGAAALRWSARGCELGHPQSCTNLGVCYHRGAGVAKSLVDARRQYRKGCAMGSGGGCYNYARLAEEELPDPEQAKSGFALACELQDALGCRSALRRSADLKQALSFAERGCQLQDPPSCASKALLLAVMQPSSSATRESAAALMAPCSRDEPVSCGVLGMLYAAGVPMTRDLARAEQLLQRACRHGSTPACKLGKNKDTLQGMRELLPHIARSMSGVQTELTPL
jgi:TPR repeat protein